MTEVIQQCLNADPFIPFTLALASRTTLRIPRADCAQVDPDGGVMNVKLDDGYEAIVSLRHVVTLTWDAPPDLPIIK